MIKRKKKIKSSTQNLNTMSYLSYTAAISQSGTGAPVARIYANEIGGQDWTWVATGRYQFLCNTYLLEKAWASGFSDFWGTGSPYIPLSNGGEIFGYYTIWPNNAFVSEELSGFTIGFVNAAFEPAEMSDLIGSSTLYLPEIRVYT
jgi:hypothetical protein